MLTIKNGKIIDELTQSEVKLNGVNLGGWLMMEGYILGGRNIPESEFKKRFEKLNGKKALYEFEKSFRENFITEEDIKYIKRLGFNCVRVPFHWKVAEKEIFWLEKVVEWCKKYKVYCILDMHSVPGSQNGDWHSDPEKIGKAKFWADKSCHKKYYALWDKLSKKFAEESIIAGYDIMNEPVIKNKNWSKILADVYNNVISIIRSNNDRHIIFLEGNMWASQYEFLKFIKNKNNIAISIHYYLPVEYTFNLIRGLRYPLKNFNRKKMFETISKYKKLSDKYQMPIYVGEFGINLRCDNGCYGEKEYINDVIEIFNELSFHWTIWTYKTIYFYIQPTGLLVYNPNPPFILRQENDFGWERYIISWGNYIKDIKKSWFTEYFSLGVLKFLKI